jgi:hypothetical protein
MITNLGHVVIVNKNATDALESYLSCQHAAT